MTSFGDHPADGELLAYVRHLRDALIEASGAATSDWNERLHIHAFENEEGEVQPRGLAYENGTLGMREDLMDALRDLWHRPGADVSRPERLRQQVALAALRHELEHFLVPGAGRFAAGLRGIYRFFGGFALEEGATEAAAQNHASIAAAPIEARAPGTTEVRGARTYGELTPATREFAAYLGRLHSRPASDVLNVLTRQDPEGKYRVATRLVLEAGGLWNQIPHGQRSVCERAVRETIWNVFSLNRGWAQRDAVQRVGTRDPEARSRIMGLQLVAATERTRLAVEYQHGTPTRTDVPWHVAAREHELGLAEKATRLASRRSAPDVRAAAADWWERLTQEESVRNEARHPDGLTVRQPEPEAPAPVQAAASLPATTTPRPRPRSRSAAVPRHHRTARTDRTLDR